jgi:hypothetical protein
MDKFWYADQIAQSFITRINIMQKDLHKSQEKYNVKENLGKDSKMDESASIQTS